ncbi:MAG: hypothetical protein NTW28_07705, partial [Candidatus Solibacter sp.]|nr:hypothetical protein [Candidatus Solibacter sp.]
MGFYRTIPIGSISMLDEDKALAASLFHRPSAVFLLIETGKSGIGDARFCFWGEGELFDWPLMPFPFDPAQLAIEERRRRSRPQPASLPEETVGAVSEAAAPGLFPVSPVPAPVKNRRQASARRWLVAVLLTLVFVSVSLGALWYFRRGSNLPVAPPPAVERAEAKTTLGLAADRRGSDLLISWNGNAPVIAQANFGMLLIRGGKE